MFDGGAVDFFFQNLTMGVEDTLATGGLNVDWQVRDNFNLKFDVATTKAESGPDAAYGYLATEKHYKNFELNLEFKQEADGNSGVFIRSTIEGVKVSGWQVEVAPKGKHTGGVYESYGRGWLIKPEAAKEEVLKEGEWNQMKIVVNGDTLTSYLNGVEMITITDAKIGAGDGSVALQIHDGGGIKVKWKNIEIKELD